MDFAPQVSQVIVVARCPHVRHFVVVDFEASCYKRPDPDVEFPIFVQQGLLNGLLQNAENIGIGTKMY